MVIEPQVVQLKNGQTCILRSPEVEDAEALINYLRVTAGETEYLLRYPEEVDLTIEEEEIFIKGINNASDGLKIVAEINGEIVGRCCYSAVGTRLRNKHRMQLSIAVYKKFWGCGVGTALMQLTLDKAKEFGFEQAELEVVSLNARAITLYKKLGFKEVGCIPKAMKYKEGRYDKLIVMAKEL